MASLPCGGVFYPNVNEVRFNCEAFALRLRAWSQEACEELFQSDEEARQFVYKHPILNKYVGPVAGSGAANVALFWYPTPDYPRNYHWSCSVTECGEYCFAAKLGKSKGIYLYKTLDSLKEHVFQVYGIPTTTEPVYFGIIE